VDVHSVRQSLPNNIFFPEDGSKSFLQNISNIPHSSDISIKGNNFINIIIIIIIKLLSNPQIISSCLVNKLTSVMMTS